MHHDINLDHDINLQLNRRRCQRSIIRERGVEFDAFENKNLNISDSNNYKLVQNVDLNIYQGKLNVIIGESGAGKSLTARAL